MLRFPVKCARLRPAACRPDPSQTGWTSRPPPFLQQFFLFCHISELALRVPLVFTKKHGIYAARLMLRLRLAFANRTYYTMMPRRGPNKTAFTAVLHGSMFSSPCAKAHRRTKCAQPRKRRAWGYYTMAPRSGLNKTAPAAVLHGSMFSSPCAKAHRRTKCAWPRKRRA